MRTDALRCRPRGLALTAALLLAALACAGASAKEESAEQPKEGADWQSWHVNNDVADLASVQRGARNFVSHCLGCHSLKYERWSRLGADLRIPPSLLQQQLLPPGDKTNDYILTSMPAADAANWFGKTRDISLIGLGKSSLDSDVIAVARTQESFLMATTFR